MVQLWTNYSVSLGFLFWFTYKWADDFHGREETDRSMGLGVGCAVIGERRAPVGSGWRFHVVRAWELWKPESPNGVVGSLPSASCNGYIHPCNIYEIWTPTQRWIKYSPQHSCKSNIQLETQVWSLGQEDPLEEEMATHSSILDWEIS